MPMVDLAAGATSFAGCSDAVSASTGGIATT